VPAPVTVPLHLTDEQMTAVYEKMVEIGFWDYPANFAVHCLPGDSAYTDIRKLTIALRSGMAASSRRWIG